MLAVDGLRVLFPARGHRRSLVQTAVDDVSFELRLREGTSLAVIGESGCGKTSTALALMGLVAFPGRVDARAMVLHGPDGPQDISRLDPKGEKMRRVRGGQSGMVFQDAAASLSPVRTVGGQLRETTLLHQLVGRREAEQRASALLERVGVPDPEQRQRAYVHELSGGLSQRVGIALALAGNPQVLIADEPTTALDSGRQDNIIELIRGLQTERGLAVLYASHDLGLVADAADHVAVMYLGRIVETAPSDALLTDPRHPYTEQLLESPPRIDTRRRHLPTMPGRVPRPGSICRPAVRLPRVVAGWRTGVALGHPRWSRSRRGVASAASSMTWSSRSQTPECGKIERVRCLNVTKLGVPVVREWQNRDGSSFESGKDWTGSCSPTRHKSVGLDGTVGTRTYTQRRAANGYLYL